MIIFKALFDCKCEEANSLFFKENDIIVYLFKSSPSFFIGKNVITGKIGLISPNSVSQIEVSESQDNIFVIRKFFDFHTKGDLVIASKIRDNDVIGHLWTDEQKAQKSFPLKYLVGLKVEPSSKIPSTTDTNEESISMDTKNKWIALFDYQSENKNHLQFVQGENLKFIDRIDHHFVLMQNASGSVGHVPYCLIKNVSTESRSQKNDHTKKLIGDHETKIESPRKNDLKDKLEDNRISNSFLEDRQENVYDVVDEYNAEAERSSCAVDEYDYISATNKKHLTRTKIIQEILETEQKFLNDMKLTLRSFDHSEMENQISEQDRDLIFGDLKAVVSVSEEFCLDFSQAVETCGTDVPLGCIFLKFLPSFEAAYKECYVNRDKKFELISKKSRSREMEEFLKEGLKKLNDDVTTIMDIDDMLMKPLQRFLKYPLFMNTIIQNTDEEHADLPNLRSALLELNNIAIKINEKKRFKELSTEIFERNEVWHTKVLHAIKKHPKRALEATLYGTQYEEDPEYQIAVSQFKDIKESVALFVETILFLRDNLREGLSMYSSLIDDLVTVVDPATGSSLSKYLALCQSGRSGLHFKYIQELQRIVVNPLIKLHELFSGPKILIKKRKSKYLDYFTMKQKMEDKEVTRTQADRTEELKNQYLTINNTLKEELPLLTSKSTVILHECIANYLQLTSSVPLTITEGLQALLANIGDSVDPANCRQRQTEIMDQLLRSVQTNGVPDNVDLVFLPPVNAPIMRSDSISRTAHYIQTKEDIIAIKAKFESKDLAVVKKDFIPTKQHHINVSAGNIVGIQKRQDPTGNTNTWLVEVSPKRVGYVPVAYLNTAHRRDTRKYSAIDNQEMSRSLNLPLNKRNSMTTSSSGAALNLSFSTTLPRKCSTLSRTVFYDNRIALYNYRGSDGKQFSMQQNDKLRLLEGHDKLGNVEWSLVINMRTGEEGYVPSNYISGGPL